MKDNSVFIHVTGENANDQLQNALMKHGCGLAANSVPSMERVDVTSVNFVHSACLLTGFWRGRFGISSIFTSSSAPFSSHSELVKVLGHQLEPLGRFCNQRPSPLSSDGFSTGLHKRSWGLPRWEERLITCRELGTFLFLIFGLIRNLASSQELSASPNHSGFISPTAFSQRKERDKRLCSVLMMRFKSETHTLCWWVTFKSTVRQRRWSTPTL